MTLEQLLKTYQSKYDIHGVVNLDDWYSMSFWEQPKWLRQQLENLYLTEYQSNQRIIVTLSQGDEYTNESDQVGNILVTLQQLLNQVDIGNFFVVLLVNDHEVMRVATHAMHQLSTDPTPVTVDYFENNLPEKKQIKSQQNVGYDYNSTRPLKIDIEQMTDNQKKLLLENKHFCIYPWIHMFVEPSGRVFPCCGTLGNNPLGNTNKLPLKFGPFKAKKREAGLICLVSVETN
jgi:hypothetical protein